MTVAMCAWLQPDASTPRLALEPRDAAGVLDVQRRRAGPSCATARPRRESRRAIDLAHASRSDQAFDLIDPEALACQACRIRVAAAHEVIVGILPPVCDNPGSYSTEFCDGCTTNWRFPSLFNKGKCAHRSRLV